MLRCELHAHSNLSDGIDSVSALLKEALKRNIHAISISDHDTLEGSLKAIEIVERENLPLTIIPGYELSAKEGHLLVFGKESRIEVLEKGIGITEACEKLRRGCLTVLAHPYQFYRSGVPRPSKIVSAVDAVEVFNSRSILPVFNKMASKLARKNGKSFVAGSDAHSIRGIGFGLTLVDSEAKVDAILREIKSGNTRINCKRFPLRGILQESFVKIGQHTSPHERV